MHKHLIALALATLAAQAHALSTGDIAFTSFNADDDGWAVVSLVDLPANTVIYFSDNEWNGSAFNDTNEHALMWNTGTNPILAGTVVVFTEIDATPDIIKATIGTLSLAGGAGSNLGLAKSNETFYAYLGTSAVNPTTFLAAITTEADAHTDYITNAGLTLGTNAIALDDDVDFGEYTGARSGQSSFADYKPMVFNKANWAMDNNDHTGAALDATPFTITPVPEPETYALMLAGLGLVGWMARPRTQV